MKVIGLDHKQYSWKITRYNSKPEQCSSLHLRARALLEKLFPYDQIYEEVIVPGIKTEINDRPLIFDFYIHSQRLVIETQGEQHYTYNRFFHINKLEFFRAKKLDVLKRQWCGINGITLVELPYNELDQDWELRIRNR